MCRVIETGFFVEMGEQDFTQGMINGYWVQAWTALVSELQFYILGIS
jgi:hypothetical protein